MASGENPFSAMVDVIREEVRRGAGPSWNMGEVISVSPLKVRYRGVQLNADQVAAAEQWAAQLKVGDSVPVLPDRDDGRFAIMQPADSAAFASAEHDHDSDYAALGHDHDSDYLGLTAKAADAAKLDGLTYGNVNGANRKIKVVAGVLRYPTAKSGWVAINDAGHIPVNISSVTTESNRVDISYGFTASKVISLVAVPDEYFAQRGYFCGCSVGTKTASIYFQRHQNIGGYIYYTSSDGWNYDNCPGVTEASWSSGLLTLTHADVGEAIQCTATGRGGYVMCVESCSKTTTQVSWYLSGSLVTTQSTALRGFFSRMRANEGTYVNPNTMQTDSGNIWVYGIFEIT